MNPFLFSKQLSSYFKKDEKRIPTNPIMCLSFFDIIRVAQLFGTDELTNKLKEFIVNNLKPDLLKELLSDIKKGFEKIKSPKIVFDLIEHRINWIEDFCRNVPVFSWIMPNPVFVGDQNFHILIDVIRQFLKSDQPIKIHICGGSLDGARKLIRNFFKEPRTLNVYQQIGYSVMMEVKKKINLTAKFFSLSLILGLYFKEGGSGKSAYV